jgi:AhpC/TSA family
MKIVPIIFSLSFVGFAGCGPPKKQVNHFASLNDTLIIQTEKIKGYGMFPGDGRYCGYFDFLDTIENHDISVIVPKGITNMVLAKEIVDFKPIWYRNLKDENSNYITTFLKDYFPTKIDTLNIPSISDNSISIIFGLRGKDSVFIVDENNNKDFRDDSIRLVKRVDWKLNFNLIKCKYKIYNGNRMADDSSWLNIGIGRNNNLFFSVAHYIDAVFFIDNHKYQIGVINGLPSLRFCFDSPMLAIITQNDIKKDTLEDSDLLKKGEYLNLADRYYRFNDISNDGKSITLIKENDFNKKIGTQVGMLAPDFNCKSIDGESIRFKDYKGKYLLLINVSACWSEESSYKCYKDLTEFYKNKLEFLGIDNSPIFLRNNINNLKLSGKFIIAEGKDNEMLKAYRPQFCSRTCFLINPEGRIVDKFEIFDWKHIMKELFVENQ